VPLEKVTGKGSMRDRKRDMEQGKEGGGRDYEE